MGFKKNNPGCLCCPDISGGCDLCTEGTPDPLPITLDGWQNGTSVLYPCGSCSSLNATYNLVFEFGTASMCKWVWGGMSVCGPLTITAFLQSVGSNARWAVSITLGSSGQLNPIYTSVLFYGSYAPYPIECGGVEVLSLYSWSSFPPNTGGSVWCHPEFLTCQVN